MWLRYVKTCYNNDSRDHHVCLIVHTMVNLGMVYFSGKPQGNCPNKTLDDRERVAGAEPCSMYLHIFAHICI